MASGRADVALPASRPWRGAAPGNVLPIPVGRPKRTVVILSTYNGARYLEPLLESVTRQDHPRFSILARDDGSTDATPDILARHAGGTLRTTRGSHVGAAASFFDLLRRVDDDVAYVAFCDQDDVWMPDKLRRATDWLDRRPAGTPAMYCGRTQIVAADLTPLALSLVPSRGPSFANALVENVASGCTLVINRAARRLLTSRLPAGHVAHDWWMYLVISMFGHVGYDTEARVLYRQHESNAVGVPTRAWDRWVRRIRPFMRNRRELPTLRQAREFDRLFGADLRPAQRKVLTRFLQHRDSWRRAVDYAMHPDVFRQGRLDHVILKALILLRLA